ncbi:ABC transporter-like protein [Nocardioides sp. CF8]|uniref:ABC transporter ATP-binding protein n=1 Tax=Nocardioides sp. CF8 TaxID=110319 RepID=UPI00032EFBE1|nr:ABC transporter ATP-binding protein [Nocardioides sp. CF8]EON22156.1 ABC transporter-like protein [Nocardioides sp. CF8]
MTILQVNDVACGYGDQDVVTGVTLNVDGTDFSCILGSNNAGKSTLINCISGLVPARGGAIVFQDEDITGLAPFQRVRRGLVQVPEGRQLFPEMTVLENVIMGGNGDSRSRAYDRALLDDVYDLFPRIKERSQQRAGSLSGGEQQMVAIARALMSRPTLLMLDEPSLGLAPLMVEAIFNALSSLNGAGVPILLVEQNLHMSLKHARYAYVLERGSIVIQGTSDELSDNDDARRAYLGL